MPAGKGKRCDDCYWRERCNRAALQFAEMLTSNGTKLDFLDYADWVVEKSSPQRIALTMHRHVEFFSKLDGYDIRNMTEKSLLDIFGANGLRKYELPVRWLVERYGIRVTGSEKINAAERSRFQSLVHSFPDGTSADLVLKGFEEFLERKLAVGKLQPRSARLAMRPAVTLLQMVSSLGINIPRQSDVDRYLEDAPGQRNALSTFVGYLRMVKGLDLRLKEINGQSKDQRKRLENALRKLVEEGSGAPDFTKRWLAVALPYFHRVSSAQYRAIIKRASISEMGSGFDIQDGGMNYWVPKMR